MPSVLITGASRGLGLELATQYAKKGWKVIATCRSPKTAIQLQKLATAYANIELVKLDLAIETDINEIANTMQGQAIDHLILNAGLLGADCATIGEMTQSKWLEVLTVNTVAPALLIQALKDNVAASEHKTIVGISTRVASLSDNSSGNMYSYRASKTAFNQVLVSAAQNLREFGIKILAIHPGWIQTDMGGADATFTPMESAAGIIKVAENVTIEESGSFKVFDGSSLEW